MEVERAFEVDDEDLRFRYVAGILRIVPRSSGGRRRDEDVATLRFDWYIDAKVTPDRLRPGPGGIDERARGDVALRCSDDADAMPIELCAGDLAVADDLDALCGRALRETNRDAV